MKYKRYIFPVLMGFTMSNIMSLVNTGTIRFPAILVMMALQAAVATATSLIVPVTPFSVGMTKRLLPKAPYPVFVLVSMILPAVFFTMVMSFTGLLKLLGYGPGFWAVYFKMLPVFTLYAYGVVVFWTIVLDYVLKKWDHISVS